MSNTHDLGDLLRRHQLQRVHLEERLEKQVSKLQSVHRKQMKLLRIIHEENRLNLEAELLDEMIVCMSHLELVSIHHEMNPIHSSSIHSANTTQVTSVGTKNQFELSLDNFEHSTSDEDEPVNASQENIRIPSIRIMPTRETNAIFENNRQARRNRGVRRLGLRRWGARTSIRQ